MNIDNVSSNELIPNRKNRNLRRLVGNLASSIRKMHTGYSQTVSVYNSYVMDPILWLWIGSSKDYDIAMDMSLSIFVIRKNTEKSKQFIDFVKSHSYTSYYDRNIKPQENANKFIQYEDSVDQPHKNKFISYEGSVGQPNNNKFIQYEDSVGQPHKSINKLTSYSDFNKLKSDSDFNKFMSYSDETKLYINPYDEIYSIE